MKSVTIVVPVYGDWPSLSECIKSLVKYVDTGKHKIMLVNDCGPDVEQIEQSILALIAGAEGFEYHRNDENLGFVGTCNRAATELDSSDNDILLLNSDTVVTTGFLDEMLEVLYSEANIGVVSPRSNNATIATIPLSAIRQGGVGARKSFRIFKKINQRLPRYSTVPTAHGFCMLIRRSLIKKYGLFDPVFGKGYGEEVDFCMRIRTKSYTCTLSNRAFVYHREARSFSKSLKKQLITENDKLIRQRYPSYHNEVHEYLSHALELEKKALPAWFRLLNTSKDRIGRIYSRSRRLILRA